MLKIDFMKKKNICLICSIISFFSFDICNAQSLDKCLSYKSQEIIFDKFYTDSICYNKETEKLNAEIKKIYQKTNTKKLEYNSYSQWKNELNKFCNDKNNIKTTEGTIKDYNIAYCK